MCTCMLSAATINGYEKEGIKDSNLVPTDKTQKHDIIMAKISGTC